MTPDTAFLIGSVSKPITAALVGQLVTEGVLAWDETVWPHLAHLADKPPGRFTAPDPTTSEPPRHRTTAAPWPATGA